MASSGFQLAGSGPEAYERFISRLMAPFTDAVVERGRLVPGMSVVDVACGTGSVARAAAERVGRSGRVIGLDINEGMLEVAKSQPSPSIEVEWHHASALEMPFSDDTFEAVLCKNGVMFFPDLDAGLAEMVRVAAPNARIVISCWGPIETSPYMRAYDSCLRPLLPEGSLSTNDIAFSIQGGIVAERLRALGVDGVQSEVITEVVTLPPMAETLPLHLAGLPYGPAFTALGEAVRARYIDAVTDELTEFVQADGSFEVPFTSHVISGNP